MVPKRILIVSEASDLHSDAVAWALRKKGHDCELLLTPDFPTLLGLSLRVGPDDLAGQFVLRGPGVVQEDRSAPFDTVSAVMDRYAPAVVRWPETVRRVA